MNRKALRHKETKQWMRVWGQKDIRPTDAPQTYYEENWTIKDAEQFHNKQVEYDKQESHIKIDLSEYELAIAEVVASDTLEEYALKYIREHAENIANFIMNNQISFEPTGYRWDKDVQLDIKELMERYPGRK